MEDYKELLIHFISALVISLAILGGSWIISTSPCNGSDVIINNKDLMTQEELQRYLSLSESEIDAIIEKDKKERSKLVGNGSWNRYQFIPYLEIKGEKRFILSEVNEWLKLKSEEQNNSK